MGHFWGLRSCLSALFGICILALGTAARAGVVVTPVGTPTFLPVDIHVFAAPIGTAASGYAEFGETQQHLLPAPDHVVNPILSIGPGAPHAGPYDQEFADGIATNGFVEGSNFTTNQYSNGSGVWFTTMLVPGSASPSGSSPDFASGPILANAMFPLTVEGSTFTNGAPNDSLGTFQVPALVDVPGFENLDGYSHIPLFFADSFDFASSAVPGSFEYRISVLDVAGNGFQIVASFEVSPVPEPAIWMLVSLGGLMLGGAARRRQRVARG